MFSPIFLLRDTKAVSKRQFVLQSTTSWSEVELEEPFVIGYRSEIHTGYLGNVSLITPPTETESQQIKSISIFSRALNIPWRLPKLPNLHAISLDIFGDPVCLSANKLLRCINSYIGGCPELQDLVITLNICPPKDTPSDMTNSGDRRYTLNDAPVAQLSTNTLKYFTLRVVDAKSDLPFIEVLLGDIISSCPTLEKLTLIGIPAIKDILSVGIIDKLKSLESLLVASRESLDWVTNIMDASTIQSYKLDQKNWSKGSASVKIVEVLISK